VPEPPPPSRFSNGEYVGDGSLTKGPSSTDVPSLSGAVIDDIVNCSEIGEVIEGDGDDGVVLLRCLE
jgi:hypothetical protein